MTRRAPILCKWRCCLQACALGPGPEKNQCSVSPGLSGESETLVVGVYLVSSWIYELTGARYALLCFMTHVETGSAPRATIIRSPLGHVAMIEGGS